MSTMTYLGTAGTGKTGSILSIYFLFPQLFLKIRSTIFFRPPRGARRGSGRGGGVYDKSWNFIEHTSRLANVCLWMYRKGINSSFLTRLFVWKCVAKVFSFDIWSLLRNAARSGRRFGVNSGSSRLARLHRPSQCLFDHFVHWNGRVLLLVDRCGRDRTLCLWDYFVHAAIPLESQR